MDRKTAARAAETTAAKKAVAVEKAAKRKRDKLDLERALAGLSRLGPCVQNPL